MAERGAAKQGSPGQGIHLSRNFPFSHPSNQQYIKTSIQPSIPQSNIHSFSHPFIHQSIHPTSKLSIRPSIQPAFQPAIYTIIIHLIFHLFNPQTFFRVFQALLQSSIYQATHHHAIDSSSNLSSGNPTSLLYQAIIRPSSNLSFQ